jgi:hypothetical protein
MTGRRPEDRDRWPLRAGLVVSALVMVAGTTIAGLGFASGRIPVILLSMVVIVAGCTGLVVVGWERQRRRWRAQGFREDAVTMAALRDALRTGRLPAERELHPPLRQTVQDRLRGLRWQRWSALGMAVVGASNLVEAAVSHLGPRRWAFAAVLLIGALVTLVATVHARRRLTALAVALDHP